MNCPYKNPKNKCTHVEPNLPKKKRKGLKPCKYIKNQENCHIYKKWHKKNSKPAQLPKTDNYALYGFIQPNDVIIAETCDIQTKKPKKKKK